MVQSKTKKHGGYALDDLGLDLLPVSALYAGLSTNFCAYTYSRKTITVDDSLLSLEEHTRKYISEILDGYRCIQSFITPLPSTELSGFEFENIIHTVSDVSSPWSGSYFYSSNDFQSQQIFVLDRTFETLEDPRHLMRWLRTALKANPKSRAVIISPDAELTNNVDSDTQLSKSLYYYRQWSGERLIQYLRSGGFIIESFVTTGSHDCVVTISATEDSHRKVIEASGLPSPRNSLIITTEHADTQSTGGIGSYIKEVEQTLNPDDRPIVFVSAAKPFDKIMVTKERAPNIVDIHDILRHPSTSVHTADWDSASINIFRAVSELIFIYDQLHVIEFQEYLGIGARIVQAKKVGQIPRDVICVARCHGSQVYIDRASFSWSGMEKADVFELERMSVNLADEVSFPTKYLKDLYLSTGYDIREENSYILRLPYAYPDVPPPEYEKVRKLIFLGKRSTMKGYPFFYDLVKELTDSSGELYNPNLKEVHVIAAPGDATEYDGKLQTLLQSLNIRLEIGPLPRHEVLRTIYTASPHSVVCLPYGNDNHPVTVLEMIANRCRFVAYQTGGIPELIPKPYNNNFTCLADPIEMAKKVNELSSLSSSVTKKLISGLHSAALLEQDRINSDVRNSYLRKVAGLSMIPRKNYSQLATVLVPIYNTNLDYVATVIECLNRQLLPPKEVLFINDKSPSNEYVKSLHNLIKKQTKLPYRIIDHEINLGLAGARNTALAHCNTKYLINIDSDDVVSTSFVFDYVHFMENNPEYSACTCALESFTDDDGWNRRPIKPVYTHVGIGDCLVLGVSKNIFGHAGSCVVTEDARKVGGWDASDRSMWEDWAFFLKMASSGMHIFNFPKVNYYYRVSPTSMTRTYAVYPAEMRIARNITGLSIWESHRLYAFIKDEASRTVNGASRGEPDTLTYKIAKRISQGINRVPVVKHTAKYVILGGWNTAKKIKKRRS